MSVRPEACPGPRGRGPTRGAATPVDIPAVAIPRHRLDLARPPGDDKDVADGVAGQILRRPLPLPEKYSLRARNRNRAGSSERLVSAAKVAEGSLEGRARRQAAADHPQAAGR